MPSFRVAEDATRRLAGDALTRAVFSLGGRPVPGRPRVDGDHYRIVADAGRPRP
jgi:hypothetical protein